jgi:hypothetical protein
MFSSGYFVNEYFHAQRDGLGYLTLGIVLISTGYYFYVIGLEVTGVRKYRRQKNKAKWTAFKKKAHFHKDLFNLNNGNATEEDKHAANVIAACMKGRLARHVLHEKIMNGDNEEDKIILARIEARVAERREQGRLRRESKKASQNFGKKGTGLSALGGGGANGKVKLPVLKRKKSKMKKKKTKRSETKENKLSIVPSSSAGKEEKEKRKKLAGWGGE